MPFELANVQNQYTKDPKLQKKDVEEIFKWLELQPHLPHLAEIQIILFLSACNYDTEDTKITIQKYFSIRNSSDFFRNGTEEMIRKTLSVFFVGFLPKKSPKNEAIFVSRLLVSDPQMYHSSDQLKLTLMQIMLYYHQNGPTNGMKSICDFKFSTFSHLFRVDFSAVKHIFHFMQESAPAKLTEIHFVNTVPVTKKLITLIRPFVKTETYNKFKVHSSQNLESLYEFIPKECLPEEYGGELESLVKLNEKNLDNILRNLEFFKWLDAQKLDESKVTRRRGFFW